MRSIAIPISSVYELTDAEGGEQEQRSGKRFFDFGLAVQTIDFTKFPKYSQVYSLSYKDSL